ncbi:MAG: Rha family transcriptional regulator [Peptostreptococcaceae bacterium]|nr:Rha family transcriptional regulator [Peptostreptococcaceae bacterium]
MLPSKVQTIESRQIAEMMGREHRDLLKDIRKYLGYLAEGKIPLGDFFLESQYVDKNKQERPCYQITKKGCEFLAHKMTGEKGAVFTAKYINRFHEMQEKEAPPALAEAPEELRQLLQTLIFQQMDLKQQLQRVILPPPVSDFCDVGHLLHEQKESRTEIFKVETFPQELRETVDLLLRQEDRNFSYIARFCTSKGYTVSSVSISRYYHRKLREEER